MNDSTILALVGLYKQYQAYVKTNNVTAQQSFGAFMEWLVKQSG